MTDHEKTLKLIKLLNYKPAQTAAAMNISAKAVQFKTNGAKYHKFTAANLAALEAFIYDLYLQSKEITKQH